MIEVVRFKYADHWPIWAIVKNSVVVQCFMTEDEAAETLENIRGAADDGL